MTFLDSEILFIGEKMAALAGIKVFPAAVKHGDGLGVSVDASDVCITACDLNALARGFFLAALAIKEGRPLHISQRRSFQNCGAMIDNSRGGVMKVSAVKQTLDVMAALGMNMLQLYTEDTYTIPEYPYFGYLRGRYTPEELRELDDYGAALGIELVPCIQTLAHLGQFLQWSANDCLKDQPTILLADEDKTYAFIEAEIRAVRACFRSGQIHIGMDEAHGVGLGEYYAKHGPSNRFELLNRHLTRVVDICAKYGFKPMMWSDMFFRLGSKTNEYYDVNARVPDAVIADIPDVRLVYWDYYHTDPELYDAMFREHARMKPDTVFAGGLWTWSGFLPQTALTCATMRPALAASLKHGVKTVLATLWGDDGAETCFSLAHSLFPLFSETCWTGAIPSDEQLMSLGEAVSGVPSQAFEAWSRFYRGSEDQRNGKAYLYCDLLYPLVVNDEPAIECACRCEAGVRALEGYLDNERCVYAHHALRLAAHKARIIAELRDRYLGGDRAYLQNVAECEIPVLLREIDELCNLHRTLWMREFKREGWETMALRYGAISGRLKDVRISISEYLCGDIEKIDELEEAPLPSARMGGEKFYQTCVAPGFSAI